MVAVCVGGCVRENEMWRRKIIFTFSFFDEMKISWRMFTAHKLRLVQVKTSFFKL